MIESRCTRLVPWRSDGAPWRVHSMACGGSRMRMGKLDAAAWTRLLPGTSLGQSLGAVHKGVSARTLAQARLCLGGFIWHERNVSARTLGVSAVESRYEPWCKQGHALAGSLGAIEWRFGTNPGSSKVMP
ncbi:hypothetical protein Sjap_025709 [Stephania japonica]|uniref:Uncharacterized protein n=1 Tax=Stephania japonica TaxID=461633 RepID=A0AAP0E9Z7_9MAGN